MDLTVVSGGVELNVSGVTEDTTCLQVVYALAHATNQKGKFVLVAHLAGHEHRLSQTEKPLDIINQWANEGIAVIFELRHIEQQPGTTNSASVNASSTLPQSLSCGHMPRNVSTNGHSPGLLQPSQPLKATGRICSLPPSSFSGNNFEMQKRARPPPPTYNDVIGQRCNSLSRETSRNMVAALSGNHQMRASPSSIHVDVSNAFNDDFSRFSRQDLEKIVQQQSQYISQQKSELLNMDVQLSSASERELVQLKKQHNNLITVLNSLRNANWPLRLGKEQQEADRLHTAIDEMKTFVDSRKNELMGLLQYQQSLEGQLGSVYSNAETIRQMEDANPYWAISDYAVS